MSLATPIPLNKAVYFDATTHNPSTGAVTDADSVPTFDVYHQSTDTGLFGATVMTKRTSLTGDYRGTFTPSVANGFTVGDYYSVVITAVVNSITAKKTQTFRVVAAEATAGVAEVDVTSINNVSASSVTTVKNVVGLTTADSISALTTAAVDNILDRSAGVESTMTLRQTLRLILSSTVAKLSGAATTTVTIRDIGDTKNRITATVDANGNRSSVTTDVT